MQEELVNVEEREQSVKDFIKGWFNWKGIVGLTVFISILAAIDLVFTKRDFVYANGSEGVSFVGIWTLGSEAILLCLLVLVIACLIERDKDRMMSPITKNRLIATQYMGILVSIYLLFWALGEFVLKYWYCQQLMEQYSQSIMAYSFTWKECLMGYSIQFGYGLIMLGVLTLLVVLYDRFSIIGFIGILLCCFVVFFFAYIEQFFLV